MPLSATRRPGFSPTTVRGRNAVAGASNNEKHHHGRGPRGGAHRRVLVVFAVGHSGPGLRGHRRFNSSRGLKALSPALTASVTKARGAPPRHVAPRSLRPRQPPCYALDRNGAIWLAMEIRINYFITHVCALPPSRIPSSSQGASQHSGKPSGIP